MQIYEMLFSLKKTQAKHEFKFQLGSLKTFAFPHWIVPSYILPHHSKRMCAITHQKVLTLILPVDWSRKDEVPLVRIVSK